MVHVYEAVHIDESLMGPTVRAICVIVCSARNPSFALVLHNEPSFLSYQLIFHLASKVQANDLGMFASCSATRIGSFAL